MGEIYPVKGIQYRSLFQLFFLFSRASLLGFTKSCLPTDEDEGNVEKKKYDNSVEFSLQDGPKKKKLCAQTSRRGVYTTCEHSLQLLRYSRCMEVKKAQN